MIRNHEKGNGRPAAFSAGIWTCSWRVAELVALEAVVAKIPGGLLLLCVLRRRPARRGRIDIAISQGEGCSKVPALDSKQSDPRMTCGVSVLALVV
jgi:hypothetical protein